MAVLSIQSHVVYGHVGNAAAVFPLQRLGVEVWPINTVQFSNHPGYGGFRGRVFEAGLIREMVTGLDERGVLPQCDAVLSGYIGAPETGRAVLDAVATVRKVNPAMKFACDPVIGDDGPGIYVRAGVPEFFRDEALAQADILFPNAFELGWLTACAVDTLAGLQRAVEALHARGPGIVVVTSVRTAETPPDAIDMIVSDGTMFARLRTPRLPIRVNGAGDTIAALFLAHCLESGSAEVALARAASSVYGLIQRTAAAGSREILTVDAQDEFVNPSIVFETVRL